MFCMARDKMGEGASRTPTTLIVDESGSVIGYVSYNGRIWAGSTYVAGAQPLYDPNRASDMQPFANNRRVARQAKPVLVEGCEYSLELASAEKIERALLRKIVDNAPLGRGFSFQLVDRRVFVYERDVRPGPGGTLLVMA